jgi:hypothetical protein
MIWVVKDLLLAEIPWRSLFYHEGHEVHEVQAS